MTVTTETPSALSPYRVLDLTHGGYCICGRLLGDLGADVIKVEPPGGDPTRNTGPFYKDIPDPEKSLFWFNYNANKRGVTLNIETPDGQQILKKLARKADFLIESFDPGYMGNLGLGYDDLSRINPRIIVTSITPFGQTGPKSSYKGSDLTGWASGGPLYTMGDPDRAPTGLTFPQAMLHTGVEAAAGSMAAHWYRERTGEGQQVDVSMQDTLIWVLQALVEMYDMNRYNYPRAGGQWVTAGGLGRRQTFPCKQGYVAFTVLGGGLVGAVRSTRAMVTWMKEEGMALDWLVKYDWEHDFDVSVVSQDEVYRVEEEFLKFFKTKTKDELWQGARKRGILLAPVVNTKEIAEDEHLRARGYWEKISHPELNDTLTYPASYHALSVTPGKTRRRAPLIGEHNNEVYGKELRIPKSQLATLKQAGVI